MITSPDNPQIKHLRQLLSQAKFRRENQQFVTEGVHLLQTAIAANRLPEKIFVPQSLLDNREVSGCLNACENVQVIVLSDKIAEKISTLNTGVSIAAIFRQPENGALPHNQDCVVLDGVQDPGNAGTILRTAAACGVPNVLLNKTCADAFSPKVLRAAMGANFLLNIFQDIDLSKFLQKFSGSLNATTLSSHKTKSLYNLDLRIKPIAWVFGNEGAGVSPKIAALAEYGVQIPMIGKIESLNVAMAASVCLFEQMRQRMG